MAKDKKRRSFLDAPISEIENAGKEIMKTNEEPSVIEPKVPFTTKPEVKKEKVKRKFIYLDEDVHREAKVKAAQEGLSIKDFLSRLIKNA